MKISLLEKIKQDKLVSFTFIGVTTTQASARDGQAPETVINLELLDPYPSVRGSQVVNIDGKMIRAHAEDALEISMTHTDLELAGDAFQWDDETQLGTYKGSTLILDVAKRTGGVWLTATPFNVRGQEFRTTQTQNNLRAQFGNAAAMISKEGTNSNSSNQQTRVAGAPVGKEPVVVDANA